MALFFAIDLAFFGANALKILQGGWVTLAVALLLFTLMTTWKARRRLVAERLTARAIPLDEFLSTVVALRPIRVPGTGSLHDGAADGRQQWIQSGTASRWGRWEADTLVVDSVAFDGRSWVDKFGYPHSEEIRLQGRYRRVDADTLKLVMTITDPVVYSKP